MFSDKRLCAIAMTYDLERRKASRILDSSESPRFLVLVRKLPHGIRNCMFADRYLSSNYSRRVASKPTIWKRVTKKSLSIFKKNMSKIHRNMSKIHFAVYLFSDSAAENSI